MVYLEFIIYFFSCDAHKERQSTLLTSLPVVVAVLQWLLKLNHSKYCDTVILLFLIFLHHPAQEILYYVMHLCKRFILRQQTI